MSKYTKKQRREIADAFRHALLLIEGEVKFFICHALDLVAISNPHGAETVKAIIHSRMQTPVGLPSISLGIWLIRNHHAALHQISREAMREYRVRWLTALIEEFES